MIEARIWSAIIMTVIVAYCCIHVVFFVNLISFFKELREKIILEKITLAKKLQKVEEAVKKAEKKKREEEEDAKVPFI